MRLSEAQTNALLDKHGVYVTEVCNACVKTLGHLSFTRYAEPGEWCSRECRDGAKHQKAEISYHVLQSLVQIGCAT